MQLTDSWLASAKPLKLIRHWVDLGGIFPLNGYTSVLNENFCNMFVNVTHWWWSTPILYSVIAFLFENYCVKRFSNSFTVVIPGSIKLLTRSDAYWLSMDKDIKNTCLQAAKNPSMCGLQHCLMSGKDFMQVSPV